MRKIVYGLLVLASFPTSAEEVCAGSFAELGRTPRLQSIQKMFSSAGRLSMVNVTRGSYFIVESLEEKENLTIRFYTSALFDLYGVKREGPVRFCDDGQSLKLIGIGRREELKPETN